MTFSSILDKRTEDQNIVCIIVVTFSHLPLPCGSATMSDCTNFEKIYLQPDLPNSGKIHLGLTYSRKNKGDMLLELLWY